MIRQSDVARRVLTALVSAGWSFNRVNTNITGAAPVTVDGVMILFMDVDDLVVYLRHPGHASQSFVHLVWQGPDDTYEESDEVVSDYGMTVDAVVTPVLNDVAQQLLYPDTVAYLADGWAVRFNGCLEAGRWNDRGPAEAQLELLRSGARKPQPEIR